VRGSARHVKREPEHLRRSATPVAAAA
jgi:hypothetical protein